MTRQWLQHHVGTIRTFLIVMSILVLISVVQTRKIGSNTDDSNERLIAQNEQLLKIAKTNQANGEIAKQTLFTVKDCVTDGGACKARGEQQTAKAVGDISVAAIITAACSPSVTSDVPRERYQQLVKCVQDLREQVGSQTPPR